MTGLIWEWYQQGDNEPLMDALLEIGDGENPVPLQGMMDILEDTLDIEMVALILETLLKRIQDVDDVLINVWYPKGSDVVKRHIITVLSQALCSKYFQFLLDEYFNNPYMRPNIRKQAFKGKTYLLMNLARYFESIPTNYDNVVIAQQILRTIPRETMVASAGAFTGTKLLDVYYAMPPEDREKN